KCLIESLYGRFIHLLDVLLHMSWKRAGNIHQSMAARDGQKMLHGFIVVITQRQVFDHDGNVFFTEGSHGSVHLIPTNILKKPDSNKILSNFVSSTRIFYACTCEITPGAGQGVWSKGEGTLDTGSNTG